MRRLKWFEWLIALAILALLAWLFITADSEPPRPPAAAAKSQPPPRPVAPTAAESLLADYADPITPPIDDLRKLHRVVTGYFSVVKDSAKNPIGGNADLAAALRGENSNKEIFLPASHLIFSTDGLILDRWNTPLIVHPEAWRELELRSAGPDKTPYTADDLILLPNGHQPR
jgi:hypothetical protein